MIPHIDEACTKIQRLFRTIDRRISSFKRQTGLLCPPGCGKCCQYTSVEAGIQEFIPLSIDLWENGLAETVLEKLRTHDSPQCIFLHTDEGGNCKCSVYPYRGIICRLFGFSFRTAKTGALEILTCGALRTQYNAMAVKVKREELLIITQFISQLESILPAAGNARYPINKAIQKAIEYIGFYLDLDNSSKSGT